MIWGRPFGPFAEALPPCDGVAHGAHSRMPFVNIAQHVLDCIVANGRGTILHPRDGYPLFSGWPSAETVIHQQMHVEWLRRAYDGGLRLLCALAVNNRLLAWLMENGIECWDDDSVRAQVDAMCRVVEAPENRTWMEVAYSAADAERIVASNKLAIVLGAEVDQIELFLSHDPRRLAQLEEEARRFLSGERCSAPEIERLAQSLYDLGLRQIGPLHFMDNAFGGAALFSDRAATNVHWLNLWSEGHATSESGWPSVVGGPPDLEYRLQRVQLSIDRSWSLCRPPLTKSVVQYDDALPNHVNARGLTDAGTVLLLNLWRLGILVDVDHMSLRTKVAALALAEQLRVPVISSHCSIREITLGRNPNEIPNDWWRRWDGRDSNAQPASPPLRQPAVRKPAELCNVAGDGADLRGTTTAAASAYLHVVDVLGPGAAVAIGSDVNGLAQLPAASACCSPEFNFYESSGLPRAVSGERVWDVNADGMAHYGMLPDLICRWRAEGMREASLAPLFRSTQGYIETLARAESAAGRIRLSLLRNAG